MSDTDWLTPDQLAGEMGRPVRWVKEQMAKGAIPSVRLGNIRFFTPECRQILMDRTLPKAPAVTPGNTWGRPERASK